MWICIQGQETEVFYSVRPAPVLSEGREFCGLQEGQFGFVLCVCLIFANRRHLFAEPERLRGAYPPIVGLEVGHQPIFSNVYRRIDGQRSVLQRSASGCASTVREMQQTKVLGIT